MSEKILKIQLTESDARTIARIVGEKAMEMHKKGAMWHRGGEYLSCVDIGNMANQILSPLGEKYDFDTAFSPKKKKTKTVTPKP